MSPFVDERVEDLVVALLELGRAGLARVAADERVVALRHGARGPRVAADAPPAFGSRPMKAACGALRIMSSYEASGMPAGVAISAIRPATLKSTGWMTMASTPCVMTFSAWATWFVASFSADWTRTS